MYVSRDALFNALEEPVCHFGVIEHRAAVVSDLADNPGATRGVYRGLFSSSRLDQSDPVIALLVTKDIRYQENERPLEIQF